MHNFTEEFLKNIATNKVQGDFSPYNKNDLGKTKRYIKTILGRLSDKKSIILLPDYESYGSGFASYINVKISKKDKSDVTILNEKNRTIESHDGLLLFISTVAPYWYYGKGKWWDNYSDGSYKGGGGNFLIPESCRQTNLKIWQDEINYITALFTEYRMTLLTEKELEQSLPFKIEIESNLANKQLTVFDCFFHWED
jgi:hypothetical protein